jgi:hypothetical protein
MGWTILLILLAVSVTLIGLGLYRRGGIYQYPFLAGTTFLGFVLPQLPALANDTHLPSGAFARAILFTALCAACCGWGWYAAKRPVLALDRHLDQHRVLWLAAMLTGLGSIFYYQLSALPKDVTDITLLSGLPVIYLFFAKLLSYGLYLAIFAFARWRSRWALAVACVGLMLLLNRIIALGRRAELTEIVLVITMAAWFGRGIAAPRSLALIVTLAAGLALSSTGAYRKAVASTAGPALSEIDVWGSFTTLIRDGGLEMRNAVLRINDADRLMAFDFGVFHWNTLVFNFVPAQIVGSDLKQALMLPFPVQSGRDYVPDTGTTETGMADAFASFWYLGCLKFFVIAYALGRLYRGAITGSLPSQLLYAVSVVPAMLAITHHTQWVLSSWVGIAALLLPGLAWTRIPTTRARRVIRRMAYATPQFRRRAN